ncbi:helix-turn-helix domain-containing protein [Leuconostoc suionicum]|uniref:helix-turn-helix domain-containing protein n=1 Tax=Leuconostoc suionicum TaxID=1511761 RepID=UPI0024ACDD4E|nr:helix-turn-helix domain-containing protein [Leuconostoc suionicum]MDI6613663.1 helix-turn-helix domain-containing protein [Leuconostoc suionicum]
MESNKIREYRENEGLTLKQLSESTGINFTTLSKYENNVVKNGKEETWRKIADYFGVSLAEILGVNDLMQHYTDSLRKLDSTYENDIEKQIKRLESSRYKSFELPIVANALDLILTTDEKYFDQDDINIELSTLIGTLNYLIHNRDDAFNVDNPEFGKEEDTYKALSDTFTSLLDKIKVQNKKASDD